MQKFWYILLTLLVLGNVFPQNTITVQFKDNSSQAKSINVITHRNLLYGSVDDIITILNLKSYYNQEKKKLEFNTDSFTVKITANNPFIVITDKRVNVSVTQMPVNVVFSENSFYIPIEKLIPILNSSGAGLFSFDNSKNVLYVEPQKKISGFDITGLSYEEKTNALLIRINSNKKLIDYESWSKLDGKDSWLYITFADARADVSTINKIKTTGLLKQILVFQSPTSVQLTFKLKGKISSTELIPVAESNDILITIHTPPKEQIVARESQDLKHRLEKERERWRLDVLVIDAGHGGEDPGAISVSGFKEKDITLAVALKLGDLIKKHIPDVKVVYTRKKDQFVELYKRGKVANESGGKLFISIHCNSVPKKPNPVNGFEVYLLASSKTEHALRIAERENSVIRLEKNYKQNYQHLTEENFILLTMAQSAYAKYSELFADILQQEMQDYLPIRNNGVKQAGFYVLIGASMPNVLIELGYLSNKNDEKYLISRAGQQRIAEAILRGIKRYKVEYEKSLEEGKKIGSIIE